MCTKQLIKLFVDLVFPPLCASCETLLMQNEKYLCTGCLLELPRTNYHLHEDNPVAEALWGRAKIENISAFYFYEKGSRYQNLVHNIKYNNQKETAYGMGRLFGNEIKGSAFSNIDIIIPVPLHRRKKRKRGFNQSEWIARGLADSLERPLEAKLLYRRVSNPTQTSKSRIERWENVEFIFKLKDSEKIAGKHVLLVDDVLTTGATIDACANTLLQARDIKLSVAVLAYAL